MRRRAWSVTGRAASWSAGVMRRSRVPVHSAALVAYLATYRATVVSVRWPPGVIGQSCFWPQASRRAGRLAAAGVATRTPGSACVIAAMSRAVGGHYTSTQSTLHIFFISGHVLG